MNEKLSSNVSFFKKENLRNKNPQKNLFLVSHIHGKVTTIVGTTKSIRRIHTPCAKNLLLDDQFLMNMQSKNMC